MFNWLKSRYLFVDVILHNFLRTYAVIHVIWTWTWTLRTWLQVCGVSLFAYLVGSVRVLLPRGPRVSWIVWPLRQLIDPPSTDERVCTWSRQGRTEDCCRLEATMRRIRHCGDETLVHTGGLSIRTCGSVLHALHIIQRAKPKLICILRGDYLTFRDHVPTVCIKIPSSPLSFKFV